MSRWASPAFRITSPAALNCSGEQWARKLANGDTAALILNRDDTTTAETRLSFVSLQPTSGGTSNYAVRDVQGNVHLGMHCGFIDFTLAPHQTAFVRLTKLPGTCVPTPPKKPCSPIGPPPAPSGCKTPSAVPAGFKVHAGNTGPLPNGYYGNAATMRHIAGTISIPACAKACDADATCVAFHVFFAPAKSCAVGMCYTHSPPLGAVVMNADAILYDKSAF
mgnify:FL=1